MTPDRYERVGKLVAERHQDEHSVWSEAPTVYRCVACAALVDADHFTEHDQWHVNLDRHSHSTLNLIN